MVHDAKVIKLLGEQKNRSQSGTVNRIINNSGFMKGDLNKESFIINIRIPTREA